MKRAARVLGIGIATFSLAYGFGVQVSPAVRAYLKTIRNAAKKDYAERIVQAYVMGLDTDGIEYKCSYMAAQGVRMRLAALGMKR